MFLLRTLRAALVVGSVWLISLPVSHAEGDGKAIFNGHDLANWDGDKRFWSVADGVIRGETSLGCMPSTNTFLIWRGSVLKDFELKLKVRLRNGNSGIQYRSQDLGKWSVSGYQMELDNGAGKSGFLYEERGRKFLALVGEKVEVDLQQKPHVLGLLAEKKEMVAARYYKPQDWNDYRIVARGNHLQHFINGVQTVDVVDNDPKGRSLEGILALQIHVGPPMLVEFKDIFLKNL